jgi:hypothetical protein
MGIIGATGNFGQCLVPEAVARASGDSAEPGRLAWLPEGRYPARPGIPQVDVGAEERTVCGIGGSHKLTATTGQLVPPGASGPVTATA